MRGTRLLIAVGIAFPSLLTAQDDVILSAMSNEGKADEPRRQNASLRSRDRVPRLPNRVVARTRTFSRGRRAHAGVDYGSPAGRYVRDVQRLVADMAFRPQTDYSPAARDRPHHLLGITSFSPATRPARPVAGWRVSGTG